MADSKNQKLSLNLDLRIICALLILIIIGMLAVWKPWQEDSSANSRKITATGQATIQAEPDQYQFSPYYEKDTTDEIAKLNDSIIAELKKLGLADKDIKNNASRYGSPKIYYMMPNDNGEEKTNLSLTITVNDKKIAQKVQDYLLTTEPKGAITPYATFSTTKQKSLQDQAREEAIKDARKNANKLASGLGAKLGKVIEVSESQDGGIMPMMSSGSADISATEKTSLTIQPGQNEFNYTISVIFQLK